MDFLFILTLWYTVLKGIWNYVCTPHSLLRILFRYYIKIKNSFIKIIIWANIMIKRWINEWHNTIDGVKLAIHIKAGFRVKPIWLIVIIEAFCAIQSKPYRTHSYSPPPPFSFWSPTKNYVHNINPILSIFIQLRKDNISFSGKVP